MRAAPGTRLRRACTGAFAAAASLPIAAASAQESPPPTVGAPRYEDMVPSGPTVAERLEEIQRRIQKAAVYPPIARARGEAGEVRIAFEIEPGGQPVKVRVLQSSGSAVLDRAAERAVQSAAPLPHLLGEVNVPVRFELSDPDAIDSPNAADGHYRLATPVDPPAARERRSSSSKRTGTSSLP